MKRPCGERGMTMVMTLLLLFALLALGLSSIWLAATNIRASSNIYQRERARYAAEAGLVQARRALHDSAWDGALEGRGVTGDDVPSELNPDGVGAVLFDGDVALRDRVLPVASDGHDTVVPSYDAWVRNDPADLEAGHWITDSNAQVVVRVLGKAGAAEVELIAVVRRDAGARAIAAEYGGKNGDSGNTNAVTTTLVIN